MVIFTSEDYFTQSGEQLDQIEEEISEKVNKMIFEDHDQGDV